MNKQQPHIFINNYAKELDYTALPKHNVGPKIPQRNRSSHSQKLIQQFNAIWEEVAQKAQQRQAISLPTKEGTYLEFKSQAGFDLITKSLEDLRKGIRILNVRTVETGDIAETCATIYIPPGKESYFLNKVQDYAQKETKKKRYPRNAKLVNSIEDVRLAILESFWQDPVDVMPDHNAKWCEVWLRSDKSLPSPEENLKEVCNNLNVFLGEGKLVFPERVVVLVKANRDQLSELIDQCAGIAEFRLAKETARFWVEESNIEQIEWVKDLQSRTEIIDTNVCVCVLDTGVNNGHLLLNPVLSDKDCHAYNLVWGVNDHDGHGTLMCGLSAYGNFEQILSSGEKVQLTHKLSSVKVLPPKEQNDPKLYGYITQQGISLSEIQSPNRQHVFCMAITSEEDVNRGRPSSWSGAIDQITFGVTEDDKRLFIVSAGNVMEEDDWKNYPTSNLSKSVEDPAQSWNALTVGAFTEKIQITNNNYAGYKPLAPHGGLSPYSTTSLTWEGTKWPTKPDIVFEGGNLLVSSKGEIFDNFEDYALLSTSSEITKRQFDLISGTSAATAQAACMAAKIQVQYPDAWPETIRALTVHSAEWTKQMIAQFGIDSKRKKDVQQLLRISGYGVPNFSKALYCGGNSLTLIAQEYIQPFDKNEDGRPVTKDMHFYELPWPKEVLLELGETEVKLRITLSYFIEPGPGEIGWKDRYRYPSFGLRFDLNSPLETKDEFIKRINKAAREEGEELENDSGSQRWLIGSNGRSLGSIHSDVWVGNAAEIASCNLIGIFPVIGWWRERSYLGKLKAKGRYSLIVSLETPRQDIDIYTPVLNKVRVSIAVNASEAKRAE